MSKIVFIDFDGTLYSHKTKSIPDSAIQAINLVRKKGMLVFLCTGRSMCEFDWFDLSKLNVDGYVCSNGQVVFDKDKNVIFDNPINGKLFDFCLNKFNEKKYCVAFCNKDSIYVNKATDALIRVQNINGSDIPPVHEYENEHIYLVSAYFDDLSQAKDFDEVNDLCEISYWQEGAIDITPKNVSKITGINEVIRKYGIDIKDVVGIGDGNNDKEMLMYSGIGICMGNGSDELKNISDYVTTDIDDDGIYKALDHYRLFD